MCADRFFIPLLAIVCFSSCQKEKPAASSKPEPVIAPELRENQLANAPSTFLEAADRSPVHWQRWNPDILQKAEDSQRLIFAVIGSSRYPGCYEAMMAIDERAVIVDRLNNDFVPVLVDLDICRETSLLASILSPETGLGVSFPFFLVLSPEGAPITWQPHQYTNPDNLLDFFENSLEVVSRLWKEDPEYVLEDSTSKIVMRRKNLPKPDPIMTDPEDRQQAFQTGVRRIVSFYDEDIQTLAGSGGLFPFGLLDCLALAESTPSLPESLRSRADEALSGILGELVRSAMIDPLDGGIYSARRGNTWDLPTFLRNNATQARAARVFSRIHQLTDNPELLNAAIGAIEFAEAHYQTDGGLFSLTGTPAPSADLEWLWRLEDLESILNPNELILWKELSAIKSLGNLPSEAAPTGRLFRLNSLRKSRSLEEAAKRAGFETAQANSLFESGRKKLLKARELRMPQPKADTTPSALASFRMISAYASLFTATGETRYLEKAVALGKKCRSAFGTSRFLNERPGDNPEEMSDGRAFTYTMATQAALDLGSITLEDEWYQWARDMSTLLGEHFIIDGERLVETREPSRVVDLNFEDRVMTFGESTAGMIRINLVRLKALGFQIPPALRPWAESLPDLSRYPIIHTDVLRALALEHSQSIIVIGTDAPAELREFVSRLPLGCHERRMSDTLGKGAELRLVDGTRQSIDDLSQLKELIDSDQ